MIPDFIRLQLIGPYGESILRRLGKIEEFYQVYWHGAKFEVEDETEYVPARWHTKTVKTLIDKQAQFLFGKSPEIHIQCPEEQKTEKGRENESAMQRFLANVLKDSRYSDKLIRAAKDCSIAGRVALKIDIRPESLKFMFVPADGFVYETNLDDTDQLERIIFFCTIQDSDNRELQRIWVQKYWMENGKCLLTEKMHDGNGFEVKWDGNKENYDTGLDRIPAYVILNNGLSGDTDGESDVETIMGDDAWKNKMLSANLDSLRKSMNQIIWISGADPETFQNLSNKPGVVWDIQGDLVISGDGSSPTVQVGTIENSFSYSAAYENTIAGIKRDMYDVMGVPDLSLESTRSLITSGKGLKALYWPLQCRCEEKMNAWRPALEWLGETILYAASLFPALKEKYGEFKDDLHVLTVENQYPLPEDEDEERQLDMQEVNSRVRSIRAYLEKWGGADHKGLEADDATSELDQIIEEIRKQEDSYSGEM